MLRLDPLFTNKIVEPVVEAPPAPFVLFPLPAEKDKAQDLQVFLQTPEGETFSAGVKQLVERLKTWCEKHAIKIQEGHLEHFLDYFNKERAQGTLGFNLYKEGIPDLAEILDKVEAADPADPQKSLFPIELSKKVITNLIEGLNVCQPGVNTHIKEAKNILTTDLKKEFLQIKHELTQAIILNHILAPYRNMLDYHPGNELHYVNGIINTISHSSLIWQIVNGPITDELIPAGLPYQQFAMDTVTYFTQDFTMEFFLNKILAEFNLKELGELLAAQKNYPSVLEVLAGFERRLNRYGLDDEPPWSSSNFLDQEAIQNGEYKLSKQAEDHLAISLFYRLCNSGFLNKGLIANYKINDQLQFQCVIDQNVKIFSFIENKMRYPVVPYLIETLLNDNRDAIFFLLSHTTTLYSSAPKSLFFFGMLSVLNADIKEIRNQKMDIAQTDLIESWTRAFNDIHNLNNAQLRTFILQRLLAIVTPMQSDARESFLNKTQIIALIHVTNFTVTDLLPLLNLLPEDKRMAWLKDEVGVGFLKNLLQTDLKQGTVQFTNLITSISKKDRLNFLQLLFDPDELKNNLFMKLYLQSIENDVDYLLHEIDRKPDLFSELFSNTELLTSVLRLIPTERRLDFLRHPLILGKLQGAPNNLDYILWCLAEEDRFEFIKLVGMPAVERDMPSFGSLSNTIGLLKDEESQDYLLNNLSEEYFQNLIIDHIERLKAFLWYVSEGSEFEWLCRLNITEGLFTTNEEIISILTLLDEDERIEWLATLPRNTIQNIVCAGYQPFLQVLKELDQNLVLEFLHIIKKEHFQNFILNGTELYAVSTRLSPAGIAYVYDVLTDSLPMSALDRFSDHPLVFAELLKVKRDKTKHTFTATAGLFTGGSSGKDEEDEPPHETEPALKKSKSG